MGRQQQYLGISLIIGFFSLACRSDEGKKKPEKSSGHRAAYIKKISGPNDSIPVGESRRGEVLIAYADCYSCHAKDKRAKGPAFSDIAERYPVNQVFIKMLAQRIINGGYGAWGRPVMLPHPQLSKEDAETMVKYILSLKNH